MAITASTRPPDQGCGCAGSSVCYHPLLLTTVMVIASLPSCGGRDVHSAEDWDELLLRRSTNRLREQDQVVRFENRCLQLKPKRNQGVGAGARVTVQQWRDESLQLRFEGTRSSTTGSPRRRHSCGRNQHHSRRRAGASRRRITAGGELCHRKNGLRIHTEGCGNAGSDGKWKISRGSSRVRGAVDGFPPFPPPLGNRYAIPTVPRPDDDDISPTNKKHKGTLLSSYRGGHFYWALTQRSIPCVAHYRGILSAGGDTMNRLIVVLGWGLLLAGGVQAKENLNPLFNLMFDIPTFQRP